MFLVPFKHKVLQDSQSGIRSRCFIKIHCVKNEHPLIKLPWFRFNTLLEKNNTLCGHVRKPPVMSHLIIIVTVSKNDLPNLFTKTNLGDNQINTVHLN